MSTPIPDHFEHRLADPAARRNLEHAEAMIAKITREHQEACQRACAPWAKVATDLMNFGSGFTLKPLPRHSSQIPQPYLAAARLCSDMAEYLRSRSWPEPFAEWMAFEIRAREIQLAIELLEHKAGLNSPPQPDRPPPPPPSTPAPANILINEATQRPVGT